MSGTEPLGSVDEERRNAGELARTYSEHRREVAAGDNPACPKPVDKTLMLTFTKPKFLTLLDGRTTRGLFSYDDQHIPGVAEELGWKQARIVERLPQYKITLPALTSALSGADLIFNNGIGRLDYQPIWKLTTLGEDCLEMLRQHKN